jgi:hypothetical protein
MKRSDVCPGQLVRCRLEGPGFRRGALFRVMPVLDDVPISSFVGCIAVGSIPFKVWCFRPRDLSPANWDERPAKSGIPRQLSLKSQEGSRQDGR